MGRKKLVRSHRSSYSKKKGVTGGRTLNVPCRKNKRPGTKRLATRSRVRRHTVKKQKSNGRETQTLTETGREGGKGGGPHLKPGITNGGS